MALVMRPAVPPTRQQLFRRWLRVLEMEGKTQYVRELEMWLKSFERYFSISNLPLSDDEIRQATLRDYSEELKIVSDVIFRVSQLCALILSEEQVSYASFVKYVENSLKQDYFTDSYIRKLVRDQRPSRNMNLLMESLLDVRTTILELSKLSKISYLCFGSLGRMINREVRKARFFDFFLERKYETTFDRITNPHVIRVIRTIQNPEHKRSIASIFLEFHRILRYLSAISLQMQDGAALKRSLLIFALVHSELRWLTEYLNEQYLRVQQADRNFSELVEAIVYSLSMELKKVMRRELLGTAALQQYELIFAKIQNSQGILINCVQQTVCSIAQYFDPKIEGHELFPDYVTKLEQSLKLRTDIYDLRQAVGAALEEEDMAQLAGLVKTIEHFKINTMKFLMYKDWFEFDNFYHEICACKTRANLTFCLHRFHTFLTTLIKEVNKRAILYNYPFDKQLDT